MAEIENENKKLVVDSETYFNLQMVKADDAIAAAEVTAAKAQLNVAIAKKDKTQTILDFHYNNLKAIQEKQLEKDKQTDLSANSDQIIPDAEK